MTEKVIDSKPVNITVQIPNRGPYKTQIVLDPFMTVGQLFDRLCKQDPVINKYYGYPTNEDLTSIDRMMAMREIE